VTTKDKEDIPRAKSKIGVLTPTTRRIINATVDIQQTTSPQTDYLHTVLCQVGMPRRRTTNPIFERTNGTASLKLESGELWNGTSWVRHPLPYGACPRLIMVHISSEAIRTRRRIIDVGNTTREFLTQLGIPSTGGRRGGYTTFKKQMQALAACNLTLGYTRGNEAITIKTPPIEEFRAWINAEENQSSLWPGVLKLSERFYETLVEHAVPLDPRALGALKHSALALDVYCWLAHRLCRIRDSKGLFLSWGNLINQFGQEYNDPMNFKNEFRKVLRQVRPAYPDAKLDVVRGGIRFYASSPPILKTQVVIELPYKSEYIPWKDRTDLLDHKSS